MAFVKASKKQSKLRMFVAGPSGSGKTYSSLKIMRGLIGPEGKIAVICTERGSASKYAGDVETFDVNELAPPYHPDRFVEVIGEAVAGKYDGLILDGGSAEWSGAGGVLEVVDGVTKRNGGNKFTAWAVATPLHQRFIDAILAAPMHCIVTFRAKSDYVIEQNDRGKAAPRKIGMAAVAREMTEYEADVFALLDLDHVLVIEKTRCPTLDGKTFARPGEELGRTLATWLSDGEVPKPEVPTIDVTINGKVYKTAGIQHDDLLKVWDLSAQLEKVRTKGAAKALMLEVAGIDSSVGLTAATGATFLARIREELGRDGVDPTAAAV